MIPLLIFLFTHFYQDKNPDQILWSADRKLMYSDFKGEVPNTTSWAATTFSNVGFNYETLNDKITSISVFCSFSISKSWMKNKTQVVLKHEQLHFDITEYFTRKFYKEALLLSNMPDSKSHFKELFEQSTRECEIMQNAYDNETNHGTDGVSQKEWQTKINLLLSSSPSYPSSK